MARVRIGKEMKDKIVITLLSLTLIIFCIYYEYRFREMRYYVRKTLKEMGNNTYRIKQLEDHREYKALLITSKSAYGTNTQIDLWKFWVDRVKKSKNK